MANKTKNDDKNTISFIIDQINICIGFIGGLDLDAFISDIKACYAVSMALQVICENTNHITNETKILSKDIEWKKMLGLRNLISHDYGKIMFEDMYCTVKNDLPKLKQDLQRLISKL